MTAPIEKPMTISLYKTNVGLFIRNLWGAQYNNWVAPSYFRNYRFNGVVYEDSLTGGYLALPNVFSINTLEERVAPQNKITGYVLREDAPETLKASLKPFYSIEEVRQYWDEEDGEHAFNNTEFSQVSGMYQEKYEMIEGTWKPKAFEIQILGELEVSNWKKPEAMTVRHVTGEGYREQIVPVDLSTIVCYSDIERMLTPEFLLHNRPCTLSSDQVYKIVRAHIKENINPSAAEITSDYDFCFKVARKIAHKPISHKQEITKANGRSYTHPRFKTYTTTYKLVDIFEMTPASRKYQGYTPIQGWSADNLEDMKEQVKTYLDTLMKEINTEYVECECCNGVGVIVNKIGTNQR